MAHSRSSKSETSPPADDGESSFQALKPRLLALPATGLRAATVDIKLVVPAALGVAQQLTDPHLRALMLQIPQAIFDHAQLDLLGPAAWAAWYVHEQTRKKDAASSDALVPAQLGRDAAELETRMQRCCEYHFSDDPAIGPELARLRPGTGYRDLASDLQGYAAIYKAQKAIVEHDQKSYRPGDAARALELAQQILLALGAATTAPPEANRLLDRAWTFLYSTYTDVAETAQYVQRNAPSPVTYPSLFAIGRPGVGGDHRPATPGQATPPPAPPIS